MGFICGITILTWLSDLSLLWYTKFMVELIASLVLLFLPEASNQNEFLKLLLFLPFQIVLALSFYQNERVRRQEFMNTVTKAKHVLTWEKLISDAFPSPAFILNYDSNASNALNSPNAAGETGNNNKECNAGDLSIPFWNKAFTKLMTEVDAEQYNGGSPKRPRILSGGESANNSPARSQQFNKTTVKHEVYQEKKEESRSVKEHSSAKEIIIIRNSSVKILSSVSYNEIPSPLVGQDNELNDQMHQIEHIQRAKTPKHERASPFISVKAMREELNSLKSVNFKEMASAPVIRHPSITGFLGNFALLKEKLSQDVISFGGIDKRPQTTAESLPVFLQRIMYELDPSSPLNSAKPTVFHHQNTVNSGSNVLNNNIPGQILQEKKVMIKIPNEEPKIFEMRICSCNWAGKPSALVIFNDQTDRIVNEKLKRLDEYKDTVLSTVSHDFRTPLSIMIQLLEGMIASYEAPASAPSKIPTNQASMPPVSSKDDLQLCYSSANLLLSYVNDILDLAQMRQQKLQINKATFDVTKTLDQVIKLLSFQANAKKISLQLDNQLECLKPAGASFSPRKSNKSGVYIYNDERRLKQVLINLIGNALKFTSNGSIKLAAKLSHKHGDTLKFTVEDTGCGIKLEDLPKLFKPFNRLKSSEKVNKNGVGLGLVICKNLVSLMGPLKGIKVKSTVGKGSKFTFYIYYKDHSTHNNAPIYDVEEVIISKKVQEDDDLMNSMVLDEMQVNELLLNRQLPSIPYITDEKVNVNIHYLGDKTPIQGSAQQFDGPSPSFAQASPEKPKRCVKILAVDDHPFNLMALEKALNVASQTISCSVDLKMTYNGLEALQVMKQTPCDLVLLDCEMPIMDGFECAIQLTKLMKNGELKACPIIAMTAHQSENERLRCIKAGMTGFITKPAPWEELQRVIDKVLMEKTSEESPHINKDRNVNSP